MNRCALCNREALLVTRANGLCVDCDIKRDGEGLGVSQELVTDRKLGSNNHYAATLNCLNCGKTSNLVIAKGKQVAACDCPICGVCPVDVFRFEKKYYEEE